ncbi:MAG: peptide chain release factor N(5)-glutamine methyltransferase [Novosphingobium sp.]
MTVGLTIREAAEALADVSDTPRLDAELLMAHVLGVSRSAMLLNWMKTPVPEGVARLVVRRMRHEPVAYIIGEQEFRGLVLKVTPDVLIPRGDSECLVDAALAARPGARRVLDCGTGSGALLIATLAELPQATGFGIDRSEAALAVARGNAEALGLGGRAQMIAADWHRPGWAEGLGAFDLILANPPYVEEAAQLDPSVRDHEPAGALFAGPEGLDDYRVLIPQLPGLLAPAGAALVEIGHTQAEAVSAIAQASGLVATLHRDLANRPRALELVQSSEIPLGKGAATA